jgi:hypothetical protein
VGFGKFDPKTTALVRPGFEARFAFHALGSFANDGEADAHARIFVTNVEALKDPEQPGQVPGIDANALVSHFNPDEAVRLLSFERDTRGAALGNKFEGVRD